MRPLGVMKRWRLKMPVTGFFRVAPLWKSVSKMKIWRLERWANGVSRAEVSALSIVMTVLLALMIVYWAGPGASLLVGGGPEAGGSQGDVTEGAEAGLPGEGAAQGSDVVASGGASAGSQTTGSSRQGKGSEAGGGTVLGNTDQGVTATQVKIGFIIANLGGLQASGQAQGLREDVREVIQAYVDNVNKTGGISGRKVVPVVTEADPLNANTVAAACVFMGEQEKVFAVVDPLLTDPCFALKYKIPHTTENLQRQQDLLARAPYEASTYINGDRSDVNWVYGARDAGFFQQSYDGRPAIFGLLGHASSQPGHIEQTLKPALESIGVKIAAEYRITPNPAQAAGEMPQAVLAMKDKNVTRMFISAGFLDVTNFLNQAEAQDFHPKYFASDLGSHTQDFQAQNFNPRQWEDSQAITSTRSGQTAAGKPMSANTKKCSDMLVAAGRPGITTEADLIGVTYCDTFFLVVNPARAAGPNLTRLAWGAALQGLGEFPSAYTDKSIFRPRKFDGGDTIAYIRWRGSCRCWIQVSDFKPGFS